LAIAIYLEANKDHLKSFQLIFNRYSILSPVLGICLAFASIFYILYGYWISFVIAISGLIYTSMFSIPRMISPLNIWVLLIRVCCLSLYLYIFPLMLKEVAYILSLFMPSLMLQLSYLIGYYIFLASTICMLDIQEKMINTVTLLQVLQVSRLRTKEHGIYEYIINFIDKVKTSDIQTPPSCQCQNSVNNLNNGWCESCGIGMVPGVILPLWTSGNSEINKIIFNTQLESKHMNGAQNVIIKSLGRTPSDLKEYVKLVTSYTELRYELLGTIQCYGLTQDSTTKEYMLVMENIKKGNLRNYLNQNFKNMKWIDEKLKILISIAKGLKLIHQSGFIHKNLHSGNILIGEDADNEMNDKEFGRNPRVVEDEDVYYSQFIDLDAISKEEAFEVLDEDNQLENSSITGISIMRSTM
ncbi:36657_t:CDS:2, partial [Gigaspora margarita]